MTRGSKIGNKRNTRNNVQSKEKGSDESDEDYKVSADEVFAESEDEYRSSLADDDESEESLGEFEEDEDEWLENNVKKVVKPRLRNGILARKKNGVTRPRKKGVSYNEEGEDYEDDGFITVNKSKKNKFSYKEKEDDDIEDLCEQQEDDFCDRKPRISRAHSYEIGCNEKPRKKNQVSYREAKEGSDYDDSDYDDDVEFIPDEIDGLDDEEEEDSPVINNKVSRARMEKTHITKGQEDDDIEDLCEQRDYDFPDRKSRISRVHSYEIGCDEKSRKKNQVSYREANEGSDYDDSDYDDDLEFTLDEVDGSDEDEKDSPVINNKLGRARMQETHITKWQMRKRNSKVLKRTKRKKTSTEQVSRKKRRSCLDNREFTDEKHPSWKKARRRKSSIDSDSEFVSSGPSDYELTVSEEEREQVREASEFCDRLSSSLRSSLRSSGPLNFIKKEETVPSERKRTGRKGKETVVDMKIEVGKQVCGICLSEEGTVRGILNCCSHYFCFACIMEWSKVESRCPLCKQRFATISRTSRADGGHDLRDAVISVPECDQVYQPSEEELRGYLDPYESVLCTECLQGGDDAHMLLCDLCDSPAHTYCVGLGHEVPDGNWYCDGCRPTALVSQAQTPTTDHITSNSSFASSSPPVAREFDLNEMYVPETQVIEPSPFPRHNTEDFQATTFPTYGFGAFTLFDRRRIQRHVHQLLNNRSRQLERSDISGTTLFGSQICPDVSIAPQNTVTPLMAGQYGVFHHGRLPGYGASFMYSREGVSPRWSGFRGQAFCEQGSTSSMSHGSVGLLDNEFAGMDARISGGLTHQPLQPCSGRSNNGVGATISSFQFQEATVPSRTFQGSIHPPF